MKVTTQRTSKPLKLLKLASLAGFAWAAVLLAQGHPAWLAVAAGAAAVWALARVLTWWQHE